MMASLVRQHAASSSEPATLAPSLNAAAEPCDLAVIGGDGSASIAAAANC